MDELTHNLAGHRRRIRLGRTADAALRWAFYASVGGCLALAASKFAGVALPYAPLAAALAAAPLARAVREWARSFSLRDCAIHLDRQLGLEERLSTAIEASGPLGPMVRADAAAAMGRSVTPRRRAPREAALLAATLLLAAALAVIPAPERSGARSDRALMDVSAEQAAALEALAKADVRFEEQSREAARALREGRPELALAILEELKRRLAEQILQGGGKADAEQALLDQVGASSRAVSAELARLGRTVHAPPPAVAQAKLERQKSVAAAAPAAAPVEVVPNAAAIGVEEIPWDPRYDSVVRRYRGY